MFNTYFQRTDESAKRTPWKANVNCTFKQNTIKNKLKENKHDTVVKLNNGKGVMHKVNYIMQELLTLD